MFFLELTPTEKEDKLRMIELLRLKVFPIHITSVLISRLSIQGSKLAEASSKFATSKSHLPLIGIVGSKKLLSRNSVTKVVSLKNKKHSSACKTKQKSIWSKALAMLLTIWIFFINLIMGGKIGCYAANSVCY